MDKRKNLANTVRFFILLTGKLLLTNEGEGSIVIIVNRLIIIV